MTVTLDQETHIYKTDDGREMPSVSRILESTGVRDVYRGDPIYGVRGKWIHRATELVDAGDLDWEQAERDQPEWVPYVRAYELFLKENTVEIVATEEIVWSETWWYAGTCDRRCLLNGIPCRLDLKSGQPSRSHVVQIALYDATNPENRHDLRPVYLRKDGSYRAPPVPMIDQEEARRVGLWAAGITRWRLRA